MSEPQLHMLYLFCYDFSTDIFDKDQINLLCRYFIHCKLLTFRGPKFPSEFRSPLFLRYILTIWIPGYIIYITSAWYCWCEPNKVFRFAPWLISNGIKYWLPISASIRNSVPSSRTCVAIGVFRRSERLYTIALLVILLLYYYIKFILECINR